MEITRTLERLGLITRSAEADQSVDSGVPSIPARADYAGDPRGLDAVFRALQVIETAARQLSVDVWRGDIRLDGDQVPSFIRKPDVGLLSFGQFTAETVSSLAQRGNAYWRVIRDAASIVNVSVLNPLHVYVADDDQGRRHYSYRGRDITGEAMHLRLTHTPGEVYGLGPIQACMSSLTGALRLRNYADNWMDTRSAPPGVLSTEQALTSEEAARYKKQAAASFQFTDGPAVLGKGLKYERLLLNPSELQWLESQQANVVMVARMFGIPARLMLASIEGSSQTYANLTDETTNFTRFTLMAYLSEIEDALTELTVRGQRVKFNLDAFLRADTKTRMESHKIAIDSNIYSSDEAREIEGLSPRKVSNEIGN